MAEGPPLPDTWLPMNRAAQRLGVHATTLRRWADNGEIPVMLTPGGHRRFSVADLDQFADERHRLRMVSGIEQMWAEQALGQTRQALEHRQDEQWLAAYDAQDREYKRVLGRRLMGVILQFISLREGGDDLLEEARAIGHLHAENALSLGLPLTDALQAAIFFHDVMVEVAIQLPETAHMRPEANTRLLRRINAVLNTVQLAIAERYDRRKR